MARQIGGVEGVGDTDAFPTPGGLRRSGELLRPAILRSTVRLGSLAFLRTVAFLPPDAYREREATLGSDPTFSSTVPAAALSLVDAMSSAPLDFNRSLARFIWSEVSQ